MSTSVREKNLALIRWLKGGHDRTYKMLSSITNSTYLSKMATGDMAISDRKARSIEVKLELPSRWLDRDNTALALMANEDFELVEEENCSKGDLIASEP